MRDYQEFQARYRKAMETAFVDITKDLSKYASPPFTRVAMFNVNEDYNSDDETGMSVMNFRPRAHIIHDENSDLEEDNSKLEAAIAKCRVVAEANGLQLLPEKMKYGDPGALPYDGAEIELGSEWLANLPPQSVTDSQGLQENNRLDSAYAAGTAKSPIVAAIARVGVRVPQAMVNILHLQNNIVYNDWRQAQRANPSFSHVPDGMYRSIVLNDINAYDTCPLYAGYPAAPPTSARFAELLKEADDDGRELILLVRGINGHTVTCNTSDGYEAIHGLPDMGPDHGYPNLPVRIVYALRPQFLTGPHYTMPINDYKPTPEQPHPPTQPFRLAVIPSTTRKLFYTKPINIRDLTEQLRASNFREALTKDYFSSVILPPIPNTYDDPAMAQIIVWHNEEMAEVAGWVDPNLRVKRTYTLGRLDVD